ncbi:MAG: hypothetical protein ABI651_14605 [Verrucomicrobiota bacterium]
MKPSPSLAVLTIAFAACCFETGCKKSSDSGGSTDPGAPTGAAAQWGSAVDPLGDSTIKHADGVLAITVPGGIHDMSGVRTENNRTAPRMLQEVEGDFTVTVKVTCDFDPPSKRNGNAFNGAGILVFASDDNFLRLERNVWTTPVGMKVNYAPLFEYWLDNEMRSTERGTPEPFFKGNSTFLRLTRKGDQVTASVSHDGLDWEETNSALTELPKRVKVGVSVVNTAAKPLKVEFSEFQLVRGSR